MSTRPSVKAGAILAPTLGQIYLERVRATPGLVGFEYRSERAETGPVGQWRKMTFRDFDRECRLTSFGLMGLGVKPGDRVAILSNTRYEWALFDMAILGARAVTVPIYPSLLGDEIAYILADAGARVLVVESFDLLRKILELPTPLVGLEKIVFLENEAVTERMDQEDSQLMSFLALKELGHRQEARDPAVFERNLAEAIADEIFTICYTSGTTGTPKGVLLAHDCMVSVLEDCVTAIGKHVRPDQERLLAVLPFSHVLGRVESMATYVFGWCECYSRGVDTLMREFAEVRPTIFFAVPRLFEKARTRILELVDRGPGSQKTAFHWAMNSHRKFLNDRESGKLPNPRLAAESLVGRQLVLRKIGARFGGKLRFVVCGGAPLARELGEFFETLGVLILEGYGLAETCAPVTFNSPEHNRFGSVGRPLPEVAIKIADDGEILVKSRKVFRGYHGMPEETESVFDGGWLKTGDIGCLDPDGFLSITGRQKDLIITSAGKNVAPQKIENLAINSPWISHLVVTGEGKPYLTALVTFDRNQVLRYAQDQQVLFSNFAGLIRNSKIQQNAQRIVDEINQKLPSFEKIRKFIVLPEDFTIESGELTPSLKIKRGFVHRKYQALIESMYTA